MPLAPPSRPQDLLWRVVMTPNGAGRVKAINGHRSPDGQWEVDADVWMDAGGVVNWKLEDLSLIIEGECREMPPLLEEG